MFLIIVVAINQRNSEISDTIAMGVSDTSFANMGTIYVPNYVDSCISHLAAQASYFAGIGS